MSLNIVFSPMNLGTGAFVVVSAKDWVTGNSSQANNLIAQLTPLFRSIVVLVGENNGRFFGRQDLANALATYASQNRLRFAWQRLTLNPAQQRAFAGFYSEPTSGRRGLMNSPQTCVWVGASGTEYTYTVHSISDTFSGLPAGNYVFARVDGDTWTPIYFGQGQLADRCGPGHHRWDCALAKGATHIHVHLNGREADRLAEEDDLLAAYPQAYEPVGCNVRAGG